MSTNLKLGKSSDIEALFVPSRDVILLPGAKIRFSPVSPLDLTKIKRYVEQTSDPYIAMFHENKQGQLSDIGCIARLIALTKRTALLQGIARIKSSTVLKTASPYTRIKATLVLDENQGSQDTSLVLNFEENFRHLLSLMRPAELPMQQLNLDFTSNPGSAADGVASMLVHPAVTIEDLQSVLDASNVTERIRLINDLLERIIAAISLDTEVSAKISKQSDKEMREAVARRKIAELQKILPRSGDLDILSERLQGKTLPSKVLKACQQELDRLKLMQPQNSEFAVAKRYVETLLSLPWDSPPTAATDPIASRKLLEDSHYGMVEAKKRIIEFLAVQKLKGVSGGAILLTGAPGTGKTSLAAAIAQATNRKFLKISLAGMRDEAELRGHRRTYVGAHPGALICKIAAAAVSDPVVLLDEVDKISKGYAGDPGAVLLEILDFEQNKTFTDNYVALPFDLSRVFFVLTANDASVIPPPLIDRLEKISIPGYSPDEKLTLAERYLLPKATASHGLGDKISMTREAMRLLVDSYAPAESGVRGLTMKINKVCRFVALKVVEGEEVTNPIDNAALHTILGEPTRLPSKLRLLRIGMACGLAVSVVGGSVMMIESAKLPGSGEPIITGTIGKVMQESVRTALSLALANSPSQPEFRLHVHFPSAATPKDGPSAGLATALALTSLFRGKILKDRFACTGEISLSGDILPVGGLREKIIAAARYGIRVVFVPAMNKAEVLREVPADLLENLEICYLDTFDQAVSLAFLSSTL